jgi:WD40 repeat protein
MADESIPIGDHWPSSIDQAMAAADHLAAVNPNAMAPGSEEEWIAGLAESGIIERWEEQDFPVHLTTIREHLVQGSGPRASRVFGLYQGASAAVFAANGGGFAVAAKDRIYFYSLDLDERWSAATAEPSSHLALSAGEPSLLAAGGDKGVRIFDVASGHGVIFLPHDSPLAGMKFSDPAGRLLTLSLDRMAHVRRTAPWQELARLGFDGELSASPDGRRLTTIDDSTLAVWTVPDHDDSLSLHAKDEGKWAMLPNGGPTHWWGRAALFPVGIKSPGSGSLRERNEAAFSGDGRRLAIRRNLDPVEVIDVASGAAIAGLGDNDLMDRFGLSDGGRCIYFAENRGATVWAVDTGRQFPLSEATRPASVALSFDCRWVAISGRENDSLEIRALEGGQSKQLGKRPGATMAFNRDGSRLALARFAEVSILDTATGAVRAVLKMGPGLPTLTSMLAFSPDGRWLVQSLENGAAMLWQIGAPRATPLRQAWQNPPLTSVAFSSDSRLIATASDEASVQIWSVQDGKELMRIPHQSAPVLLAAFSPDDRGIEIFGRRADQGAFRRQRPSLPCLPTAQPDAGRGRVEAVSGPHLLSRDLSQPRAAVLAAAQSPFVPPSSELTGARLSPGRTARAQESVGASHCTTRRVPPIRAEPEGDSDEKTDPQSHLAP